MLVDLLVPTIIIDNNEETRNITGKIDIRSVVSIQTAQFTYVVDICSYVQYTHHKRNGKEEGKKLYFSGIFCIKMIQNFRSDHALRLMCN